MNVGAARASAATCSVTNPGTPYLGGGIHLDGQGKCNVKWDAAVVELQYESGGTFHDATSGGSPVPIQLVGPYGAGVQHANDFDWGNIDQAAYCAFNWRALVWYVQDSNSTAITSRFSGTLRKTC